MVFPEEYILASDADARIQAQQERVKKGKGSRDLAQSGTSQQKPLDAGKEGGTDGKEEFIYEDMILDGQRYLCKIPRVEDEEVDRKSNGTDSARWTEDENEIARATDRGLQLLQEMEGTCMYYVSGWWSYSFCYNRQVKQFHALPPGPGVPSYPPVEDHRSMSFILGKFPSRHDGDHDGDKETATRNGPATELQTKGETRYLVQRLGGGTTCDLTGQERKIEVQFHCNPQSTDRIGWIKELSICSYLMIIYTPRLCNDVAFQQPPPEHVREIECREVHPDGIGQNRRQDDPLVETPLDSPPLVDSSGQSRPVYVGDVEVGAMRLVGADGRQIEKGRVARAGDDFVEIVAKREGGEVSRLSQAELDRLGLDAREVEEFKKQLDEFTNGKDWKLGVVETNGERGFRAIVDADEAETLESAEHTQGNEDDEEQEFKDEL